VADDFEALEKSNKELVEKIKILASHIEKLQENEESVKTCIINAQISADKVMREADKKSKEILNESTEKAELLVSEAQKKAEYIYNESKKKTEDFLTAAKEKGNSIIAEAENQAIVLRNETDKKINLQKQVYERLKSEIMTYRQNAIENCTRQLEILKNVSDSELILDSAAEEDTTNEDFNKKFTEENFAPDKSKKKEEVKKEVPVVDEIKEDEEEKQGSLFEYKQ
ncbi:MAG: DivIVA domain-containing protein, partial [Acutalibacteraceae bacterium]